MCKLNNNDLSFLSKLQLVQPFANRNDGARSTMVSAHLQQMIPIIDSEQPTCFSTYNKQVVGKSTSKMSKKASERTKVICEVKLENDLFHIIELLDSKILDIVKISDHVNEGGFTSISVPPSIGDEFKAGETIRHYNETDYDDNLKIGANCNIAYNINGNNFEDALVVSESFAKKFTHRETKEIDFIMNDNEYFVNVYGDLTNYKPFPTKGESKNSRIICAKRRINKNFYNTLSIKNLNNIIESDEIFFHNGEIQSVTVFSNRTKTSKICDEFIESLANETKSHLQYFISFIDDFMSKNKTYSISQQLNYYRMHYGSILRGKEINFNETPFSGYYVKIKLVKDVPLQVGSKVTAFHANKGLVTKIVPDKNMLTTVDGRVADVIFNPNSVIGRLNLGQIVEVLLNNISRKVLETFNGVNDFEKYVEYMSNVLDEYEIKTLRNISDEDKTALIEDIVKQGKIYLPIRPFTTIGIEEIIKVMNKYKVNLNEDMLLNGIPMKNEILFGSLYLIKLKHEPEKKTSYSSMNKLSSKTMQLVKDNKSFKKHKSINNHNPSSIAEMEFSILLTLPKKNFLKESLFLKSSDTKNRLLFLRDNLYNESPKLENYKDLEHLSVKSLNTLLKVVGLGI